MNPPNLDWANVYRYPYSKLLGNLPCGKKPNSWTLWNSVIPGFAPYNKPVYPNAPNENCNYGLDQVQYRSCTPKLRFKDGDNNLAISRKILRQSNNVPFFYIQDPGNPTIFDNVTPITTQIDYAVFGEGTGDTQIGGQTPFRALMNAGDPNLSNNAYATTSKIFNKQIGGVANINLLYVDPPNQVSSTRRSSNAAAVRNSGIMPIQQQPFINNGSNLNENLALWSGNQRWVYDGSDYIKFKKLQAKNRNFNDVSWGGDRNNASQTARSRVRH